MTEKVLNPEVDFSLFIGAEESKDTTCICFCGVIYKCDVDFIMGTKGGRMRVFLDRANCPACGDSQGVSLIRRKVSLVC